MQFVFLGKTKQNKTVQTCVLEQAFSNARENSHMHLEELYRYSANVGQDFFIGSSYLTWFLVSFVFSLWGLL